MANGLLNLNPAQPAMDNGLLKLKPSNSIEAYQDNYAGWKPGNSVEAQNYYRIMQFLQTLPPEQRPTTDSEVMDFMKAYSDSMQDYSGYIPEPQNVQKYLSAPVSGGTDGQIFEALSRLVGPSRKGY